MFGNTVKVQAAFKEFIEAPEFQDMISKNLIPLLSRSEVTVEIGKKLDELLSSSLVLHKVYKQIDESLAGSGKQFIEQNLPTIFTHPDLKSAVVAQTAIAMKQVMDRTSQQSIVNHLAGHETKKWIHDNLKRGVETAFENSDFHAQIVENLKNIVEEQIPAIAQDEIQQSIVKHLAGHETKKWIHDSLMQGMEAAFENSEFHAQIISNLESAVEEQTQDIVQQEIQQQINGSEVRQTFKDIVDEIVNDNVRATFPRLVKFERLDGSTSKPILVHEKFEAVLKACAVPRR